MEDNAWSGSISLFLDFLSAAGGINLPKMKQPHGDALKQEDSFFHCELFNLISDSNQVQSNLCFNGLHYPAQSKIDIKDLTKAYDVIVLPAVWGTPKQLIQKAKEMKQWLRAQYDHGALIVSLVNTGFYLAEADLLNNKMATIHWSYQEQFKFHYPNVDLHPELGITTEPQLWCTSDIPSSLEVGISLLEKYYSKKIAEQARRYFLQNPFQQNTPPQNSETDEKQAPSYQDQMINACIEYLQQNYAQEISLEELASNFNTTSRTLTRRFKQAGAKPPMQLLNEIRIKQACQLLTDTQLSINSIAYKCGLPVMSSFSRIFKKETGMSAREWRNR